MVAILPRSTERSWGTISFASTLYLCPVLDVLLENIPSIWRPEVRLGLQEALVNAAKHGNKLSPDKQVHVRYAVLDNRHWWVICDQGDGFDNPLDDCDIRCTTSHADSVASCHDLLDCGRGLMILHQIFDTVQWVNRGTELWLCKYIDGEHRSPVIF